MKPKTRMVVACAGLVGIVGQAIGQCDVFWPGFADFDQRRSTRFDPNNPFVVTHVGLPNAGSVHCVPTALSNIMALMDSSGYNVILNASTQNWQQQLPLYNAVGTHLFNMGEYMDTDDGGTSFGDALDGFQEWLNDRGQGYRFLVMGVRADDDWYPKPKTVYARLKMSQPVSIIYGRYYRDGDELERDGGHALTAVGALDGCDLMRPQLMYHDPNTSSQNESRYEQSPFERVTRTFFRRFWNMDGDWAAVYSFDETANGTSETPVRVFDKYIFVMPMVCLGTSPVNPNQLHIYNLSGLWQAQANAETVDSPTGGVILDAVMNHLDASNMVLAAAGRGGAAGIFRWDLAEKTFTRLHTFARNPDRMLVDRHGHYYVQLGSVVEKYKLVDDRPVLLGSLTTPSLINAWGMDDATDTVVALAGGSERLIRFTRAMTVVGNTPMPGSGLLPGDGSVSINPLTGRTWVTSSGATGLYEINFDPTNGRAAIASTASHATLRNIRGVSFNHLGNMLVAADGSVKPFALGRGGVWAPMAENPWSVFRSMPMGRLMDGARPRDNRSPLDERPQWKDIDPENEPQGGGVPVCAADFNLDGFLDFFDYAAFVSCYEGRTCPSGRDADYTMDAFVDFFDYAEFVRDFEAGC